MLVSPHLDGSTPAQNQGSTPYAADMAAQLAAAQREIANLRSQLAAAGATLAQRDAELAQRDAALAQEKQLVADQQKIIAAKDQKIAELETFRKNVLKERTYLRRGDIDPTTKLTQCIAAWELGVTFGNDNTDRPQKFRTVTAETIASQVGVSKSVVMSRIAAMSTPAEGFTPVFERHMERRTNKETGMPYKVTQLAPPEGKNWLDTWGSDPATMAAPPPSPRQTKNAEHQRTKREEERATVKEARRILALCPSCGCQNVSLICHGCGVKTPAAECLPVPDCLVAESALREDAPQGADDSVERTPCLTADSDLYSNEERLTSIDVGISTPSLSAVPELPDCLSAESATRYYECNTPAETFSAEPTHTFTADDVAHLVDGDRERAGALAHATRALYAAVADHPNHVVMQRRSDEKSNKYLTVSEPLTPLLIAQHLVGSATLGAGLLTSDEAGVRTCRAVAYDSDKSFGTLVAAARQLADRGLTPLLVRNSAKNGSGHLWLFFDCDVDPAQVFTTLEAWAPMLSRVPERFPAPTVRGGHRLRLPGGCYLPVGTDPVPVQVSLSGVDGDLEWEDALSPMAWALIGGACTPAAAVQHAWIPPENRTRPVEPAPKVVPTPIAKTTAATTVDEAVARFNADYPLSALVDINRAGMFHSPWHADTSPSCKAYPDDHWSDFSRDKRGGDALALWCAQHGYWTDGTEKPERVKALRAQGYLPEEKQGFSVAARGDVLLVSLRHGDKNKWERARKAFKAAFPAARYESDDKAWALPAGLRAAFVDWARTFAAAEKGAGA